MEDKKNLEAVVIFRNGSRRKVTITSRAIDTAKFAAARMPYLFEGTGFNPLDADTSDIVAVTRADHDILHWCSQGRHEAAFRLGQMDMRASIADMLEDLADGTQGEVCTTLIDAAQRVRNLQLCDAVKEEAYEAD